MTVSFLATHLGGGGGGSLERLGISRGLFGVLAEWPAPLWSVNLESGSNICDKRRDLSSDIVTQTQHKHYTKNKYITSRHYAVTVQSQMTISNGPNDSNRGSCRRPTSDGALRCDAGFGAQSSTPSLLV